MPRSDLEAQENASTGPKDGREPVGRYPHLPPRDRPKFEPTDTPYELHRATRKLIRLATRDAGAARGAVRVIAAGGTHPHALSPLGRLHFGRPELALDFGQSRRVRSLKRPGASPNPDNQREGSHGSTPPGAPSAAGTRRIAGAPS
jgi:hypothetical protein